MKNSELVVRQVIAAPDIPDVVKGAVPAYVGAAPVGAHFLGCAAA